MKDRNNQNDEQELIGVQEQLDLHTEVLNNILPFLPPEIRAQAEAKLGEQKKLESDGAIHAKVDAVHSDVIETKSLLGELKSTVDTLSNVVANLAVKTPPAKEPPSNPPANPPENKDTKEAPKDDQKSSDNKEPKEPGKDNNAPAKSPDIQVKDTPMYLTVRRRGGRTVTRLAVKQKDLDRVNKLMLREQGKKQKENDKTDHEYR